MRLTLLICALSAVSMMAQSADMRTRAEISNYAETSSYADIERVMDGLRSTSTLVHRASARPKKAASCR
jgi:hypothetical protein